MTCPFSHMTKSAAAPEQQLPRHLRLLFELRPPVPEAFQRQAVHLAIFTLIQIATAPRFMVRPPERLKFDPVIRWPSRHRCSPPQTSPWKTDRNQPGANKRARNGRLLTEHPFSPVIFCSFPVIENNVPCSLKWGNASK